MKLLTSLLSKTRPHFLLTFSRLSSGEQHQRIRGIRENFSEYEVRLRFDEWLKALWLAPKQWVHSTRDRSIKVTRLYMPFWNINFQGSVQCSLSTKSNLPFRHGEEYYSHKEWHAFPLQLDNVALNNINVYAGEAFDRYHVQKLDVSFDEEQLVDLTDDDIMIMQSTVEKDEAFHNAWILIIKPLLEHMALEQATERYPKFEDPRIDSFHLLTKSKQERLLYYPIYVINYKYNSKTTYNCFFDGVTGHITGDRQFSAIKVTLAAFAAFYPMLTIGIFAFGTMADLLFAFEVASALSIVATLPIALVVAPFVGWYARSYPRLYKKELSQVQWNQDQSKVLKFTYSSLEPIEQESDRPVLQEGDLSNQSSIKERDDDGLTPADIKAGQRSN